MIKALKNNQNGAVAVVLTLLILSSILMITMIMNNIITNNLNMNMVQVGATKAFFASEAGAEKILWEIRKNTTNLSACGTDDNICFDNSAIASNIDACANYSASALCPTSKVITFSNNSEFSLKYQHVAGPPAVTTITAYGTHSDTARNTQIEYND